MHRCRKCRVGQLVPEIREFEPESAEQYRCDECGHLTVIQSLSIILSQLISGILGLIVTPYLMLAEFVQAFIYDKPTFLHRSLDVALLVLGGLLTLGFIYLIYHSVRDLVVRVRFRLSQAE